MYENFGDLGMNIKKMVDEFQQKAKSNQNIQTLGMSLLLFGGCSLLVKFSVLTVEYFMGIIQRTWRSLLSIIQNIERCMEMFRSMLLWLLK